MKMKARNRGARIKGSTMRAYKEISRKTYIEYYCIVGRAPRAMAVTVRGLKSVARCSV